MKEPPLKEHVETLVQIRTQDLEPDPSGGGKARIREGVAAERRVSITDPDMRHGRKSKTQLFNGYKRHVALDLDTGLILAGAVLPANRPEGEAAPALKADIDRMKRRIGEAHLDRGYIASPIVADVLADGGEILCKPCVPRNGKFFTKADFKINMRDMTITCPAGEVERIDLGAEVEFDAAACDRCPLRAQCTSAALGTGRSVSIADNERLQHRLRKLVATRRGRERLRQRIPVEHSLAHLGRRQGRRARYRGTRKNLFDLRRTAPCRTWKRSTVGSPQPTVRRAGGQRDYSVFKPFGVLTPASCRRRLRPAIPAASSASSPRATARRFAARRRKRRPRCSTSSPARRARSPFPRPGPPRARRLARGTASALQPRVRWACAVLPGRPATSARGCRSPDFDSLWQRLAHRTSLAPLTDKETAEYLERRLRVVGARAMLVPRRRRRARVRAFQGRQRVINNLALGALVAAARAGRRHVEVKDIQDAVFDLENA